MEKGLPRRPFGLLVKPAHPDISAPAVEGAMPHGWEDDPAEIKATQIIYPPPSISKWQAETKKDSKQKTRASFSMGLVVKRLRSTRDLRELTLQHIGLEASGATQLINGLAHHPHLTKLSLAFNRLADAGAAALCPLLKNKDCVVKYLNLARNYIAAPGCRALATALRDNAHLRHIDLAENLCKDEGVCSIVSAAARAKWRHLNLSKNRIGRRGLDAVAGLVRESRSLEYLGLYLNGIGSPGALMLADALMTNKSVTSLDLGANPLGAQGLFALASMLPRNTTLQSLDLRGCEVGFGPDFKTSDIGMSKLCSELSKRECHLETLLLSFNALSEGQVSRLCESLHKNQSIRRISLANCHIPARATAASIAPLLRKSAHLVSVNLSLNTVDGKAARAIGQALKDNSVLTSLDLTQCRLGSGLASITAALRHNETLRSIGLGGNLLDAEQYKFLVQKLKSNRSIEGLGEIACRCDACARLGRTRTLWRRPPQQTEAARRVGAAGPHVDGSQAAAAAAGGGTAHGHGDCIALRLMQNRDRNHRYKALAFLMGLHERLGEAAPLRRILGKSSIHERQLLVGIFAFAGWLPRVPPAPRPG